MGYSTLNAETLTSFLCGMGKKAPMTGMAMGLEGDL